MCHVSDESIGKHKRKEGMRQKGIPGGRVMNLVNRDMGSGCKLQSTIDKYRR